MKSHQHEMIEGTNAFDRFRKAMKTIASVKKSDVLEPPKSSQKKRRKKA